MATQENLPDDGLDDLNRFKQDIIKDADALSDQRERANEDMRFIGVPGGMWEDFQEERFEKRTKLEFDLVSNFINRYIGEWNQNRIGVEFKADDSATSDDDADLINGIYRADYRQYSGKMSVDNAVDEQAKCGYGCFRLAPLFEDDGDPENDFQRISWAPINNAYNSVYWDSGAERVDKRDATRCTELIAFRDEGFTGEFPGKSPVSAYEPDTFKFQNFNRSIPKIIYVAKRYEVIKKKETFFIYNDLVSGNAEVYSKEDHELIKDELKQNEFKIFVRERKTVKQHVEVTVFSGEDILRPTKRIAGEWIPIIPIYGYRDYIDGAEWYRGLVRKLMDAARLFNMQLSQLAENSASAGADIPVFFTEQMQNETIKRQWADRNNKPYLLKDHAKDNDGNILPTQTEYVKPPQLDASTSTLIQIVPQFIQDVTGQSPQETRDPDASGKAIRERKKIENLNTQVLTDNVANAIEWSGVVYESMATDGIYTSKRMVNTIGKDGVEGRKQLLQAVLDEESGKLIEANNLNGKRFRVYSDVGPQYETLREQTVEDLKGMLEAIGDRAIGEQYIPAIFSTMLDLINGVQVGPLKELNRRMMLLQGLKKPETDEEKEFLAQAQQPKEDPNQQLIAAATEQQNAEARNLDSDSLDNAASANKKQAETQKILNDIQVDQSKARNDTAKTIADIRAQVLKNVSTLPLQ